MKKLNEVPAGQVGVIAAIDGDTRFLNRVTSVGLTIGSKMEVLKNVRRRPVLLYGRGRIIAPTREECGRIAVEGAHEHSSSDKGSGYGDRPVRTAPLRQVDSV